MMNSITQEESILIDTHVLLWFLIGSDNLPTSVMKTINAVREKDRLLIFSISLWEIAMLKSKKRINLYKPIKDFLLEISEIDGLKIINILPEIAAETSMIEDLHGNPADRIIAATAITTSAILVTKDAKIIAWFKAGNIEVMDL